MSQVFGGDANNNATNPSVTTSVETPVVAGNFVNPPFGNAKAIVLACVSLTTGVGTLAVTVRIRRNPSAENVIVASSGPITAAAGNAVSIPLQAADVIPDGRPCQYQLTVQQASGTGNGSVQFASIAAILISG